jgi:hypothetical protein
MKASKNKLLPDFKAQTNAADTKKDLHLPTKRSALEDDPISALKNVGFEVLYCNHAHSILSGEFYEAFSQIAQILHKLKLPITEIIGSGGGETKFTQRLRKALAGEGWNKHEFKVRKIVDEKESPYSSHEVDHVKFVPTVGTIGCEIEWNNKDPFFDRDLENFKRLHAEGALSVGIIITRGATLQERLLGLVERFATNRNIVDFKSLKEVGVESTKKQMVAIEKRINSARQIPFAKAWANNFVQNKFGQSTTHWNKLIERVNRGVGSPCPLMLIGLPDNMVIFDEALVDPLEEIELQADGD